MCFICSHEVNFTETQNHPLKPFNEKNEKNEKESAPSKTLNQNKNSTDGSEENESAVQSSPIGSSDMDSECLSGSAEPGLADQPANQVNSSNGQKSSKPSSSDCSSSGISTENSLSLSLTETQCTSQDVEMLSPGSPTCKASVEKDSVEGTGAEVKTCSTSCGTTGPKTSQTPDTEAKEQAGENDATLESDAHKTNCTASSVLDTITNQHENSSAKLTKWYFSHFLW